MLNILNSHSLGSAMHYKRLISSLKTIRTPWTVPCFNVESHLMGVTPVSEVSYPIFQIL